MTSKVWTFFRHSGLNAILTCFIVKRIGFTSENLTFQYASEILHKQLYQTVWLRVSNALGCVFVLGAILPLITRALSLNSPRKDAWILQGSLIDIVTGFLILWQGKVFATLCIGMSRLRFGNLYSPCVSGMTICGLGEGLEPALQSFGSSIVGKANHASFFTLVSMIEVVGDLLGGPIMAWAYTVRGTDQLPAGYCFLLSAVRIN